jgi:Leucine-rich repeat (LRR) protein
VESEKMKRVIVFAIFALAALACKKEAEEPGPQEPEFEQSVEQQEPRWLIITYEGVYMEKIDVTGLEPGEDFVWIGYGTCEYPWQGEDSINLEEPTDGLVFANGKPVQAYLRYVDLEEIPDIETILSVSGDRRHLSLLKRFPNLVAVNLFCSDLCDTDLVHLASLTNLRKLDLWETQITDAGLKHLAGLRDLRWLNLSSTEITDSGFAQLAGLTNLRHLWLAGTGITNKSLTYISSFVNLRDLNLGGTRITNKGVKQLCGLTKISHTT